MKDGDGNEEEPNPAENLVAYYVYFSRIGFYFV